MKADLSIKPGIRLLTTALLSVAVFCFWGYVRPYLITERELTQMFLWNADYFMERIVVPGGLARLIESDRRATTNVIDLNTTTDK